MNVAHEQIQTQELELKHQQFLCNEFLVHQMFSAKRDVEVLEKEKVFVDNTLFKRRQSFKNALRQLAVCSMFLCLVVVNAQEINPVKRMKALQAAKKLASPKDAPTANKVMVKAALVIPPVTTVTARWVFDPLKQVVVWETSNSIVAPVWQYGGWTTNNFVVFQKDKPQQFFRFYSIPNAVEACVGDGRPQPPVFY